jgi:hypothetical protein
MSFLYRAAITITRKQPYIDWANSFDDNGPELTAELADDRRTIYLVPESPEGPNIESLLDGFWEQSRPPKRHGAVGTMFATSA